MTYSFNIREISEFLDHFYKLKEIERSGWKAKLHLKNSESVAEHTLSMIVIVLIFAEINNFNLSRTMKMIRMALIHDLGESVIGDYMPEEINVKKKKRLENKAINDIFLKIPWTFKKNYIKIWREYDDNKTEISKLIHFIDKLEMVVQAKYYYKNNKNIEKKDIMPFFDSALDYIKENYRMKNKSNNADTLGEKDIDDEIEQILLYLNK
ncbi:MAG TPA: HD domain-containing protein [Verrucomicrobiae bacterium]|nr:HD domain-containing protein [Verrucomicrobiae bacterium]